MNKWLELRKTLRELHEENKDKPDVENVTRFLLNLMEVLDGKPNPEIWISVKERMPRWRQWVLCKCRAGIYEVLRYEETCDGEQWHHDHQHNYMSGFVTHWMPLPEMPSCGGENVNKNENDSCSCSVSGNDNCADPSQSPQEEGSVFVTVPFSWLVKFCTHIDFKEPLTDAEREKLWKQKLKQQFNIVPK